MKTEVLLVEDDYVDIESVRRFLKKAEIDCNLHIAHNGDDALTMITHEENRINPDVIILDINMPKMNGLEFLKIISNYFRFKSVRIYIVSTSGEDYEIRTAMELGIRGYILKPLSLKTPMAEGIRDLLTDLRQGELQQ